MTESLPRRMRNAAAAALASALLCTGVFAQTTAPATATPQTPARIDAQRFVGAWKIDKSESIQLIRLHDDGQLGVRGQDSESVWEARCVRQQPGQFECNGTGEKFPGSPFLFHSTLLMVDGRIQDAWSVDGRGADGKLVNTGGHDWFDRIAPAK